jgi:hypothetical protein
MILQLLALFINAPDSQSRNQSYIPVSQGRLKKLLVGKKIVIPPPGSVLGTIRSEIFHRDGVHIRSQERGGTTSYPYKIEAGRYCVESRPKPHCVRVYETRDHKLFASDADNPRELREFAIQEITESK